MSNLSSSSGVRTRPSAAKVFTAFTAGLLVGAGLVFPIFPETVDLLLLGSLGPVGQVLLAAVSLLMFVIIGFITLFQVFVLID